MLVTDITRETKRGQKIGYYMDGYLKENLDGVPKFLKKKWDVMGVVTGRGLVGPGKSTMTLQVGYYLAWLLAGGKMITERKDGKLRLKEMIKPTKPVRFGMENIVFTPEDLMTTARKLYKKYVPNQIIVYDEGRSGLDSANAMMAINKTMVEFMQRCRVYHHIMLIVLPDFFKLHEDYAVSRSLFLIDVYPNQEFERGFFSFFNKNQKEKLFHFGKKRLGVTAKYTSATHNFWGRFTDWMPVDKKEYDKAKMKAIEKITVGKSNLRYKKQRDAAIFLVQKYSGMPSRSISKELSALCNERIGERGVRYAISNITKEKASDVD